MDTDVLMVGPTHEMMQCVESSVRRLGLTFATAAFESSTDCDSSRIVIVGRSDNPPTGDLVATIVSRTRAAVVFCDAEGSAPDRIAAYENGAIGHLDPSCSDREVVARLQAVLRLCELQPQGEGDTIVVRGVVIDRARREVRLDDGSVVRPTTREFDLLWYFAEHVGLALSRSQILDAVWGWDYTGEPRTVDVHVRQLRRRFPGLAIETIRGVGYRLKP